LVAKAYDEAAKELYKDYAKLNFENGNHKLKEYLAP
jgi:hypothetical protein